MNKQALLDAIANREDVQEHTSQGGFSISDVVVLLLNKRWTIILLTLLISLAGTYFSSRMPTTYSAISTIALNPIVDIDQEALGSSGSGIDNSVVESEIQVLQSRTMLESVIDRFGIGTVKQWLSAADVNADPELEKNRMVDKIYRAMSVLRRESSYVLEVEVTATTPEGAAAVSNAITDGYLASKASDVSDTRATSQLRRAERLESLRTELEAKNQAVADFMATNGLVSANGSTMVEQTISEVRSNLMDARSTLYEYEARLKQLFDARAKGGSAEGVVEVQNSVVMNQLRSREIEIRRRIADLAQTYGERHPERISAQSELDDISRQIDIEIDIVTSSLQRSVETSRNRVADLEAELANLRGNLNVDQRARVQLQELQREAETTERIYRDLLIRTQDFSERAERQRATARLLSRAVPPVRPSSPPLRLWAAFWTGMGLFLGLAVAVLLNLFQNKIVKTEDIERNLNVKALVSVPHLRKRQTMLLPAKYVVAKPLTTFAECYRVLLSEILIGIPSQDSSIIAITSAMAGDGKTTTSMCLANIAAMSGMKVAVVDCDFRMRALSSLVKSEIPENFRHIFSPKSTLEAAHISDPDHPNLHFYPIDETVAEYDQSAPMTVSTDMFDQLREHYDLVLLDCAPVLAVASTRIFTSAADASIIVTRWNKTPLPALRTTIKQITRGGGETMGVVLNAVDTSLAKHYSFGDTMYFGQAGKGYYTS